MIMWLKCFLVVNLFIFSFYAYGQSADVGIGNGIRNGNYIGGVYRNDVGNYTVYNNTINPTLSTVVVRNTAEFIEAVKNAEKGDIIYVSDNSRIDLSRTGTIEVREGVTIASNRGINKSLGALIFTNKLNANPLFVTSGGSIRFIGLRLVGPDGNKINKTEINKLLRRRKINGITEKMSKNRLYTYAIPNSQGIRVRHKNVTIENCEISNWSHAAIAIYPEGEAHVIHSYIHHNQRHGLGYGILVEGTAWIEANVFDFNRHAIASSGRIGANYVAQYNIALPNSSDQGHIFDVHGGVDRKDGTNIAGEKFRINNNLFYYKKYPVVKVRGRSMKLSEIYNNVIIFSNNSNAERGNLRSNKNINPNSSQFVDQLNKEGNMKVYNNVVQSNKRN